MMKKYH